MSEVSTLTELANFIAKSPLASQDMAVRNKAVNSIRDNLMPKSSGRKVVDLLGTVMALSARTRRMVQPKAGIELDVFAPSSRRAVVISLDK